MLAISTSAWISCSWRAWTSACASFKDADSLSTRSSSRRNARSSWSLSSPPNASCCSIFSFCCSRASCACCACDSSSLCCARSFSSTAAEASALSPPSAWLAAPSTGVGLSSDIRSSSAWRSIAPCNLPCSSSPCARSKLCSSSACWCSNACSRRSTVCFSFCASDNRPAEAALPAASASTASRSRALSASKAASSR